MSKLIQAKLFKIKFAHSTLPSILFFVQNDWSYVSAKCVIGRSKINKYGVFAKKEIIKDEIIAIWGGRILNIKELKRLAKKKPNLFSHSICIFDKFHLVSSFKNKMEICDYMNHSCAPNSGIKGQIILVARKKIDADKEITFDYETTEIEGCGGMPFICNCQSKSCRNRIDGNAWRNKKFQKKNQGYFSWYIQQKILMAPKKS